MVKTQIKFCEDHLLKDEPWCLQWKQIPLAKKCQIDSQMKRLGKTYLITPAAEGQAPLEGFRFWGGWV